MLAVVVVLIGIVTLMGVLVVGLLRSHADIIRALHSLGAGVGDPSADGPSAHVHEDPEQVLGQTTGVHLGRNSRKPPLPAERSAGVHDVVGVTPAGDQIAVAMKTSSINLLVFLTSGCSSCGALWAQLSDPRARAALPRQTRIVVVTKGSEWESPQLVAAKAPADVVVVMTTSAWEDYEIPGAPYFILVDGRHDARLGEGVGQGLAQIGDLIGRAAIDDDSMATSRSQATSLGLNGPEREAYNDEVLRQAGILPGDPSLYPPTLSEAAARMSHSNEQ